LGIGDHDGAGRVVDLLAQDHLAIGPGFQQLVGRIAFKDRGIVDARFGAVALKARQPLAEQSLERKRLDHIGGGQARESTPEKSLEATAIRGFLPAGNHQISPAARGCVKGGSFEHHVDRYRQPVIPLAWST
jgi:hypothetical protein